MGLSHLQHGISTIAKPIALGEFIVALANVLKFPDVKHNHAFGNGNGAKGRKIGLAISGGVDSMALALLCSQLQAISPNQISNISNSAKDSLKYLRGVTFQAFIVDHGARIGSNEEANSVAAVLHKQGILANVRQIKWPQNSSTDSSNFESLARKYRFRTLGEACKEHALDALLLAHHEDDQAETVFMRLAAGHRIQGLTGIKGDSEIPECYGLHGVHESGAIDNLSNPSPDVSRCFSIGAMGSSKTQLQIESGGVRVCRPLLVFSKARLRATCEDAKMKWFEDHTNKDPTLTKRNAIRHMYSSRTMPPALTKPAILAFSQRCKDKAVRRLATVDAWLAKCNISSFETRSGVLAIKFPELGLADGDNISQNEREYLTASILRRVVMLVTPEEHIDLTSLSSTIRQIFPELNEAKDSAEYPTSMSRSRTVAGVLFQPQHTSPRSWLLSRQPHFSKMTKTSIQEYPGKSPQVESVWSRWILYDGRFWIRIRNHGEDNVVLSHFQRDHLKEFSRSLGSLDRIRFEADLKCLAPGDIRWTLPALVVGKKVLALPTLGFKVPDCKVEWEVRYKKVDLRGFCSSPYCV